MSLTRRHFVGGAVAALGAAHAVDAQGTTCESRPVSLQADLVVAGGGTAGTAAAIAAARRGHRVLLIEEANCLGGTSTSGGVCEWFANREGLGNIFDRVHKELLDAGVVYRERFFNSEILKLVWQRLAEEAGVQVLLHASLIGARAENGRVREAQLVSCSKTLHAAAQYFVDATGEGDLAAAAGAEFLHGDPVHHYTLHMTLTFVLHDTGKPVRPYLPPGLKPIQSNAELPGLSAIYPLGDGRVYFNTTKVTRHDPTDPLSLSQAELEARRQLAQVVHYMQRTRYPTYALCSSGARIGIREGRRIVGDYVLREQDILGGAARHFDDGVAVATSQIDFLSLTKPGSAGWRQQVEPYRIPLRCLTVKGLANVLTAGKCISGDQVAHSSYRMTPTCCAMGQAAGTAVAMALEQKLADIRQLDVRALQRELTAAGMELDPTRHKPFSPHGASERGSDRQESQ
jgi:hypothetical protein